MALNFPIPTSVGQVYQDPTSGNTYVCTSLGPPAQWVGSGSSTSLDSTYLRTDASNDPVTGNLLLNPTTNVSPLTLQQPVGNTTPALKIENSGSGNSIEANGFSVSQTGITALPSGTAASPSITTSGDTNTGIYFPAADTIGLVEGGTEVVRINSSGNVGIGTTSPASLLHVNGTITASGTTASTSTTTGALVVTGGLGVGGSLFAGGTVAAFPSADLLVGAASTSGPGNGNDLVSSAIVQEFSLAEPQACLKGNMSQPSGAVGGSIGTAQVIHWIKSLAVADTRSRLVIPFVAQGVQHQNTFVKIFAKCDLLNTSTNVVGFEATFIANHLNASITAIQSWGLNGNISTITTSGLSVRLNFSSAFPSGSTLVVYIQSMPYSNSRSIDFANVVVE